jgi:hypothetical protein
MIETERRALFTAAPKTVAEARRGTNPRSLRELVLTLAPEPARSQEPEQAARASGRPQRLGCWWDLRYRR